MKDIIVTLVILSFVFGGNYIVLKYYEDTGEKLLSIVEKMNYHINDDSKYKEELSKNLLETWEKYEEIWICTQYHHNINNIEDLVLECNIYFLAENKEEFTVSWKKLKRNIDDLRNREELDLVNIL